MNVSPTTSHDKGTGRDTVVTRTRVRLYDPVVMRFTTIDPLAERYYPTSPYAYCQNDPLAKVDPTGMDWREAKMHFGKSCDVRISFGFQAGLSLKAPGVTDISIQANVLSADIFNSEGPNSIRSGASMGVGFFAVGCENSVYYIDDTHAVSKKSGSVQASDYFFVEEETTAKEECIGADQWRPIGSKQHTSQGDIQITEGPLLDKLGEIGRAHV